LKASASHSQISNLMLAQQRPDSIVQGRHRVEQKFDWIPDGCCESAADVAQPVGDREPGVLGAGRDAPQSRLVNPDRPGTHVLSAVRHSAITVRRVLKVLNIAAALRKHVLNVPLLLSRLGIIK
jgi:hypothetical protein